MAYEPTNWKTGDVVTSAKLDKLEQAVAGGVLVAHIARATLDRTWQEIYDAFLQNGLVVLYEGEEGADYSTQSSELVLRVWYGEGKYYLSSIFLSPGGVDNHAYECDSPSGYPKENLGNLGG